MPDNKHNQIIQELERRAKEVNYGVITVELKIHEGKIMAGEIIGQRIKLG
jgi:hypothetical protein